MTMMTTKMSMSTIITTMTMTKSVSAATTITTTMTMMTTKMSMSTIITTMAMTKSADAAITITTMMTMMSTSITIIMTASVDAATTITTTIMTPTRYSQAGVLRQTVPSQRRNSSPCYRNSHIPRSTARFSAQRECCRMRTEHGTTSILFRKRPRSAQALRSTQEKCA